MICNVIANGKIPVIGGYRAVYGVDLTDSDIDKLMQFINSGTRVYVADTGRLITPENIDEILGRSSGGEEQLLQMCRHGQKNQLSRPILQVKLA